MSRGQSPGHGWNSVTYSGRLDTFLPQSTRLLIPKNDGPVLIHADAGGYKPPDCES